MSSRQIYLRLLTWVKPYWRVFVIAILGMVATAATEPVAPWLLKTLIDNGFKAASEREIILLPLAIVGIFILRGIATFTSGFSMAWIAARVVFDLRQAMFGRLMTLPTRFYDDQSTGVLISKVAYDVSEPTIDSEMYTGTCLRPS